MAGKPRFRFCRWKNCHFTPSDSYRIGFKWHGGLYYLVLQFQEERFIRHAVEPLLLAEPLQFKSDCNGKPINEERVRI